MPVILLRPGLWRRLLVLPGLLERTRRRRLALLVLRDRPLRRRSVLPLLLLWRRNWPRLWRSRALCIATSVRLLRPKLLPVAI